MPAAGQGLGETLQPLAQGQPQRQAKLAGRHNVFLGLEGHRHRAECWRTLAQAVGGCITRSRESGVKEEMTGEAWSCLVCRALSRAECDGPTLPEPLGPGLYLNCLISERARN